MIQRRTPSSRSEAHAAVDTLARFGIGSTEYQAACGGEVIHPEVLFDYLGDDYLNVGNDEVRQALGLPLEGLVTYGDAVRSAVFERFRSI